MTKGRYTMPIQNYINEIVNVFTDEMNDNLVGVYLHGSLAMGCFNPETSDVDLLVICQESMPDYAKRKIIKRLLSVTQGNKNQLEMSIIQKRYLKAFEYPTPFELHYFHPKYLMEENYICGGKGFEDPDLAAHIMVTYHRGIKLIGPEIKSIMEPINRVYYIHSIFNDIEDAPNQIVEKPVYFTLNLCRVMHYLLEGKVSSKKEGGEWAGTHLPEEYQRIVKQCLDVYNGGSKEITISDRELIQFAKWMFFECTQLRESR